MCVSGEEKVEDPKKGEDLPEMELQWQEKAGRILPWCYEVMTVANLCVLICSRP